MQKQSLFLAASIAILLAMSSVGHAQSYYTGNSYGTVVWAEQGMIQPASVMPVGVPVNLLPVSGFRPAPPIPFSQTQQATPFVLPAVPVSIASPVQYVVPTAQQVSPPVQHMMPPVQHTLPTTTIRQPVCLSGG